MVKVRVSEMPPLLLLLLVAAAWTGAAALTSDELRVIMESAAEAAVHSEESDSSEESSSEVPLLATLPAPPLPPPTPTVVSSRSDPLAVEQTRVVYPRYLPAPAHGTAPTPTNSHAQGVAHGSPTAPPPPPLGPTPHTLPDGSVRDWISALTALAVEAEKAPPGMTLAVHGAGAAGTAASPGEVGALIAPYATRPSRAAEAAQTIEYSKYPPAYAPYSPYRGYRYYPSTHVMSHMYPGHYAPRPHYPPPPPMTHMGRYPRHYMAGMYRSRVPPCMAAEETYADPEVYRG